jgi:hypothetical protein
MIPTFIRKPTSPFEPFNVIVSGIITYYDIKIFYYTPNILGVGGGEVVGQKFPPLRFYDFLLQILFQEIKIGHL